MATANTIIAAGMEARWHTRLADTVRGINAHPEARRGRRVVLLVFGLSLINLFDLIFTLLGMSHTEFVEMNPVAACLIHHTAGLVVFKVVMTSIGLLIMLRFRKRLFTELSCWGLCGVYSVLAGIWWTYWLAPW
ncbi:MAG TPA: DUF5658 family protein [Phycisphaerae bacterium]|nr:DUF5658 family protein [Phycisphaerae bacterium]